jgi:hypothetical protein
MSNMEIRRDAIKALEDADGRTTADRLVQAASNPEHPMHPDFVWDDAVAGHLHRLDTARRIIASVTVIITDVSKRISAPAYVRDPDAPAGVQGYRSTARLRTERESAQEALLNEATRLQGQLDRMRDVAAALDLSDELDAVIEAAMTLRDKLRRTAETVGEEVRPH